MSDHDRPDAGKGEVELNDLDAQDDAKGGSDSLQTLTQLGQQTTLEGMKNQIQQARNTLQSQSVQNEVQNF